MTWSDKIKSQDGGLQYQFAYSGVFDGELSEVQFDWGTSPSLDLILPPGTIKVKSRVKDGFGGTTPWMPGGDLTVQETTRRRMLRRVLAVEDQRWHDAQNLLLETLDLEDSGKTNQLSSALAIEVNDRFVNGRDDNPTAMQKKDILLQSLRTAATAAVKTEGYVCETLSATNAVSSNVGHISSSSVTSLSDIISSLMSSDSMDFLQYTCIVDALTLQSVPLRANFNNQTCTSSGRIDNAADGHMKSFLDKMDLSLDEILSKSSSNLLAGQQVPLQSANSSDFGYLVKKVVPNNNAMKGDLASGTGASFSIPPNVAHASALDAVSVLFGKSRRPPAINRTNPISDILTLTLAHPNGTKLDVHGLSDPINITMTVDEGHLCPAEIGLATGIRCLYWNSAVSYITC